MLRSFRCVVVAFALLALVIAGCGPATRQPVKTVKVSGTVTLAGKPLTEADVNFVGKDYAGITKTDASGNYTIDAQPGENAIFFSKFDAPVDPTMGPSDTGGQGGPKQLVPKKYASAVDSKLTQTVGEEDATGVNFDLK